ncbi:uncharacterized protein LOC126828582 [Patella vulgata]|nr:uncharacterized protein LOC126828582 [Patella vulgata]
MSDNSENIERYIHSIWQKRHNTRENHLLFNIENINIYTNTIRFAKDKIPDEVIDAYMFSIIRQQKSNYQYLKCTLMSMIFDVRQQAAVSELEIVGETVIGVLNIGSNHWMLIVIYINTKTILLVDPLGELERSKKEILQNWRNFININESVCSTVDGWVVNGIPHPKQPDSISCGVLCLKFAEKIISGLEVSFSVTDNDLSTYRMEILKTIFKIQGSTVSDICRICSTKYPKGQVNNIQWIGCDKCMVFWVHYKCMRTLKTFSELSTLVYICPLCTYIPSNW